MQQLINQVAVVTGAAQGIGQAIAVRFAAEGAAVVVADLQQERGEATVSDIRGRGGRATFAAANVSRKEDIVAMVAQALSAYGRVDILVQCAQTFSPMVPLEDKTDEMFATALNSGLWGSLWGMRAVFPHMKAAGGGRIINCSSLYGEVGMPLWADYAVTKSAIDGLTRVAAREWAPHNILVNALSPIANSDAAKAAARVNPELVAASARRVPLGRLGDCDADIAGVALFLASKDAAYCTGQCWYADGGARLVGIG